MNCEGEEKAPPQPLHFVLSLLKNIDSSVQQKEILFGGLIKVSEFYWCYQSAEIEGKGLVPNHLVLLTG